MCKAHFCSKVQRRRKCCHSISFSLSFSAATSKPAQENSYFFTKTHSTQRHTTGFLLCANAYSKFSTSIVLVASLFAVILLFFSLHCSVDFPAASSTCIFLSCRIVYHSFREPSFIEHVFCSHEKGWSKLDIGEEKNLANQCGS